MTSMSESKLTELRNCIERHRTDRSIDHEAVYYQNARQYFEVLVEIAEAAKEARGQLNRQIPHTQRTFNALNCLRVLDKLDDCPFYPRKPKL